MELNETTTAAEEAGEVIATVGREIGTKEIIIGAGIAAVVIGLGVWGYKKWRNRGQVATDKTPEPAPVVPVVEIAKAAQEHMAAAAENLHAAEEAAEKSDAELRYQMEQAGM